MCTPSLLGQDTTARLDGKGDREECCELLAPKHDMPGSGHKKEKGTKRDLEVEWNLERESDLPRVGRVSRPLSKLHYINE